MQNLFYLSEGLESLFILLGVLGLMGIIVVAVIIFKKKFKQAFLINFNETTKFKKIFLSPWNYGANYFIR